MSGHGPHPTRTRQFDLAVFNRTMVIYKINSYKHSEQRILQRGATVAITMEEGLTILAQSHPCPTVHPNTLITNTSHIFTEQISHRENESVSLDLAEDTDASNDVTVLTAEPIQRWGSEPSLEINIFTTQMPSHRTP